MLLILNCIPHPADLPVGLPAHDVELVGVDGDVFPGSDRDDRGERALRAVHRSPAGRLADEVTATSASSDRNRSHTRDPRQASCRLGPGKRHVRATAKRELVPVSMSFRRQL